MVELESPIRLVDAERRHLARFMQLIGAYLAGEIPADRFEPDYFELFKGDPTRWPRPIFTQLNEIFLDLDGFNADPDLREGDPFAIDEDELRRRVTVAFAALHVAQDTYSSQS